MNSKNMSKKVKNEITQLRNLEKKLKMSIEKAPAGKLRCATKGKSFQYYVGKTYLGKDKINMIEDIANREYQEKLLSKIQKKIKMSEKLLECLKYDYSEDEVVYLNLHPARKKLVSPIITIKSEYIKEWESVEYDKWEVTDEQIKGRYYTVKGERVRSKSEKIIADELTRYGIPYRYEYPLQLNDGGRLVKKRPDFIAINPNTLEEKIIEHFGMMDSDKYYNSALSKIDLYERNGYLIGVSLIILHETSDKPIDTKVIDGYIEEFLI